MNYYEELGLDPGASNEEIRRVYKRLTRLLHPDQQQDPDLRDLADRQMKRLNEIQEVLTDPDKRAAYDRELAAQNIVLRPPPPSGSTVHVQVTSTAFRWLVDGRFLTSGWTWVVILVCSIFLIAAWFPSEVMQPEADQRQPLSSLSAANTQTHGTGIAPADAPPASTTEKGGTSGAPANPPSRQVVAPAAPQLARGQSQSASRSTADPLHTRGNASAAPAAEPSLSGLRDQQRVPNSGAQDQPRLAGAQTAQPVASQTKSLTGDWLYSRNPDDKLDPKQYPADYIELKLVDQSGKIQGSYKATYLVPDRAISPRVTFLFEGDNNAPEFAWSGNGGAAGRIRLRRKSEHSMEVTWYATEMGAALGLGSGSAILYRRQGN